MEKIAYYIYFYRILDREAFIKRAVFHLLFFIFYTGARADFVGGTDITHPFYLMIRLGKIMSGPPVQPPVWNRTSVTLADRCLFVWFSNVPHAKGTHGQWCPIPQ